MHKHILVIDDERVVRKAFSDALQGAGFEVDTAESGPEGVEMNRRVFYDLIFLDLDMPGVDGVETLRRIRETDRQVLIYIFSAYDKDLLAELDDARREDLGFGIIHKPAAAALIVKVTELILEQPEAAEQISHAMI